MTQINEFVDEAVQGFDGKEMKYVVSWDLMNRYSQRHRKLLQARLASEQKLYKDSIDGWEEDNAKLDQINVSWRILLSPKLTQLQAEINVVAARAQGLLTQQRELVTKTQQEVDELCQCPVSFDARLKELTRAWL